MEQSPARRVMMDKQGAMRRKYIHANTMNGIALASKYRRGLISEQHRDLLRRSQAKPAAKVYIWGPGTLKKLGPYCKLKGPLSTCSYHQQLSGAWERSPAIFRSPGTAFSHVPPYFNHWTIRSTRIDCQRDKARLHNF